MARIYAAIVDEGGSIRLLEKADLPAGGRALVTVLEEGPAMPVSEIALAGDWGRPEEDAAWSYLDRLP